MSEEKEPTSRVVFLVALVAVLIPFAYVGIRLAKQSEWLSIPHRMPFVNAEGKKLPQSLSAPEECRMGDIAFGMLLDGDKVWIPCKGSDQRGGLARMDLTEKRVDYRWQFPDWKLGWTRGLLPVANGGLATLVGIEGGIGAAVAGPDGWLFSPQKLAVDETDRVLALAFRDGALQVAISHIDAHAKPAWASRIVTFSNGGVRSRNVEVCGEKCGGIHAAYFGADARFHFIVSRDYSALAEDITEDGVARPTKTKITSFIELDSTSTGAIGTTFTTRYVLGDNGAIVERAPPPVWLHGSVWASIAFRRSGDRLSRIPVYASDGTRLRGDAPTLYALSYDKDSLRSGSPGTPGFEDETLGFRMFEESTLELVEKVPKKPIARIHECNSLASDGMAVRLGDDTVVFDPSGCYVTLDKQLRRKDAWGLYDHLRMRGSMYLDWNERSHAPKLIFVLLAPLFVLGAWLGRRRYPRAMIVLAVVTPALAIWCSIGLSDLLR
jgi:hypothetical protein